MTIAAISDGEGGASVRGKLNSLISLAGGGTSPIGVFQYLNSDAGSNELQSLAHFETPVLNGFYFYNFFDGTRAVHSAGIAKCIATSGGSGSLGSIYRQTSGTFNWTGMAMIGFGQSVYALTTLGDSFYLGALGFDTTGVGTVNMSRLALVVAEAVARRYTIRSGGDLSINAAMSFGFANVDMITTRVLPTTGYVGEMLHIGSRTSKSNVSVPISARLYSEGLDTAGNTFLWDESSKTFDFREPKNTIGLVVENLNTGLCQVDALLNRHAFGVYHRGNTEKIIANYNFNDTQVGITESVIRYGINSITRGATTTIKTERPHPFIVGDMVAFTRVEGTTGLNTGFLTVTAVPDRKTVTVNYDSSAQPDHVGLTGYIRQDANGNTTADSNRVTGVYQRCFESLRTGADGSGFFTLTVESRRDPGWWVRAGYDVAVTISNGGGSSPGVVTHPYHGKANGTPVILRTSGALPTGYSASTVYYIVNATTLNYQLSATVGGAAINTSSAGSGTHKVFYPTTAAVTISNASPAIVAHTAHGYPSPHTMVILTTTGTLPAGLSLNTAYYLVSGTENNYQLSLTPGGTAINTTTAGSGTHTAHYHSPVMIPLPIVEFKTGKNCCVKLDCRGNQGRLGTYVDRDEPAGATGHNDKGILEITSDDNFEGTVLLVDRANDLVGYCRAAETYDGKMFSDLPGFGLPVPGPYPCPSVQINQVKKSFNFPIFLSRCAAREGIRYGDATKGLRSVGITFAPALVHMSTYDASAGDYATTQTALVFEYTTNCKYSYTSLHGNITLMAGCQGAEITVPADWVQHYTATIDAAATATFMVRGVVTTAQLTALSWVRPGLRVVAQCVSDKFGAGMIYDDGEWRTVSLEGHTHAAADVVGLDDAVNEVLESAGQVAVAAPSHPGYVAGECTELPFRGELAAGTALGANSVRLIEFSPLRPIRISELCARVTTTSGGGNFAMAIYANDPATKRPTGAPLATTISAMSTASAAQVSSLLSAQIALTPGQSYWLAFHCDNGTAALEMRSASADFIQRIGAASFSDLSASAGAMSVGLSVASAFGTWPNLTAASFTPITGGIGTAMWRCASVPFDTHVAVQATAEGGLAQIGATWGIIGDGLVSTSGGVGSGSPNYGHRFGALMGGRLQPVAAPILGRSGSSIARLTGGNHPWTNPYAIDAMIAQRPNVFIFGSCGANDNLLATDPTGNVLLQDWRDAVTYAFTQWDAYAGGNDLFVVVATIPSTKAGETTHRANVWTAQEAHVAAIGDSRVVWVGLGAMLPPSSFSVDSGALYVHSDERGAYFVADAIVDAIDARVQAATIDEVLARIYAGTYPLMSGSQLDTDRDLVSTGGTLTNVTDGGGGIALSKLINNTTGSASISAAMATVTGGQRKIVVTLGGTASSTGKLMIGDRLTFSVTASPGQYVRTGAKILAPAGYFNFGADFATWGISGGGAGSIADNTRVGAADTHSINSLLFANEQPLSANSTSFANRRNMALLWRNGTALSGTVEFSDPFAYLVSDRDRVPAAYLGGLADGNGALQFTATYRMRATGTISQAAGGTLRVEPGTWSTRGLTNADFVERRIYRGVIGDVAVGSGTLIATLSGGTWTNAFGAAVVTTGDRIFVEVDAVDPITGDTVTARSHASDALTAT